MKVPDQNLDAQNIPYQFDVLYQTIWFDINALFLYFFLKAQVALDLSDLATY
jgi:hypothetical protein